MKELNENCYKLLRQIPLGKVTTYKILADKLGTKSYRGIGQVVGANRDVPNTPCHRVVKSTGELGGYAFGIDKKITLLKTEGVEVANNQVQNFTKILHKF